jgi:hypothetical protein
LAPTRTACVHKIIAVKLFPQRYLTAILKGIALILIAAAILAMVVLAARHSTQPTRPPVIAQVRPADVATNSPVQAPLRNAAKPSAPTTGVLPNYPDFQQHPLPVAYESAKVQWTVADGKDTNVIRQLAHNPLEYDRMVEENPRIFKRQLVYLKETAASVFEQAKLNGAPVKQLTLPGVDGQELQFEIVRSEGNGSSRQGQFSGHLAGNTDSLVTLAFIDGREAFTVLSPKENFFVVGEPREDGQVIVKAIDPNTYGQGPEDADDSFKTASANK